MTDVSDVEETNHKALLVSLNKIDEEFALKIYKDSNIIASKTQIHSFLHNMTCFKYGIATTRKCRIEFPYLCIEEKLK